VTTYVLPDLTYDYGALAPHIAGEIMELHHSRHHQAYIAGLNSALVQLAEARDANAFGAIGGIEKSLRSTSADM
jgi:superoxide dismutase, Fe-Mn family